MGNPNPMEFSSKGKEGRVDCWEERGREVRRERERERETIMLAVLEQNLLRTQVSTINSSAELPAGDLVLPASPVVTKTKKVIRQENHQ